MKQGYEGIAVAGTMLAITLLAIGLAKFVF
jgi:hypothetical protein